MRVRNVLMMLPMVTTALAGSNWDTHFSRGENLERNGRYEQAAVEFESALGEAERETPDDVKIPVTLNNLGVVYRALDRTRDAEGCYLRAIGFFEKRSPRFEAPLATALENLAALHLTLGRLSKAEPLYRRSYALRVKVLAPTDPAIAQSLQGLGRLEQERHEVRKAEAYYRQALVIQESALGPMSITIAPTLHNLASVLDEGGRLEEARVLYDRTLAIYRAGPASHPAEAIVLRHLAELDARAGAMSRADARFQEALAICEKTLPAGHAQTGVILQAYGRFLDLAKRKKEARAVIARANRMVMEAMRTNGSAYTVDVNAFRGN